jgi:hypothetical protein
MLLDWQMVTPAIFDHEKLDVYQLELKFLTRVTQFLTYISRPSPTQTRELRTRTTTSTRTNESQIEVFT